MDHGQYAFVATAEKALLDLVYLQHGGDKLPYLQSLRLQNLDQLNVWSLKQTAEMMLKPKLIRAARNIVDLVEAEAGAYEQL